MPRSPSALPALALALAGASASVIEAAPLKLHVPSPDWRDQIIYFVVTDRFADGDPTNNDLHTGEFRAGSERHYNGGDLAGLTQRLDYIRGLGATALWITPPVANQWVGPHGSYTGYHGYWAENFRQVDRHLGTLADYQRLSHALHTAGMYLVQDIVVNHTGDYFDYPGGWDARDPARYYVPWRNSPPVPAPSQPPFDRNDPRNPAHRIAGIYHWTPGIADFNEKFQELNFQMAGLDDLNTENPTVRRALRASYGHWIRQVGVDAFRVDTAFYVPPDYFTDFLHAADWRAPGIATLAQRTGRQQFHIFGEGFGIDQPYHDEQALKIESYMTGPAGEPLLPGMLNFPLYGTLGDVFARGRPTAELAYRITRTMQVHARPHLMPTFVDNHDVDRFLAGGTEAGLKQALLALMTLPGIPVIYYGTEQGFTQPRAAMFAAGWGSGGRDHYNPDTSLYRFIAAAARLRHDHHLFSRGTPAVLKSNPSAPGALAWRMTYEGEAALVVLNTSTDASLLDNLPTDWPAGTVLQGLFGLDGTPPDLVVGPAGRITLKLPPRAGWVWQATTRRRAVAPPTATLTLDPLPAPRVTEDFIVRGTAREVPALSLVVDGDLTHAQTVQPAPDGRWQARIDTTRMVDPKIRHTMTAWCDTPAATSESATFQVTREWSLTTEQTDPVGDDVGPTGNYRYPTHSSWGNHRQMDLHGVKVLTAGTAVRLDLKLHEVTAIWNPPNGFDHVAFTIFLEIPGREGGTSVMPLQNANLPAGMRWHLRLRVNGWSNAAFDSNGATATQEGTPITPAALLTVDRAAATVSLVLPAALLGRTKSLSGLKIYVTTWDYDGGYRGMLPTPSAYTFGGAAGDSPKVMDNSEVLVLP